MLYLVLMVQPGTTLEEEQGQRGSVDAVRAITQHYRINRSRKLTPD